MTELYQSIVEIAKTYMGLIAEEYLARRCRVSLDKSDPTDLEPDDLDRLAAGIDMTAGAYISEEKAKRFKEEILRHKHKYYLKDKT